MIPKECKRLAEVDFPIAIVSKHSAREKSIRHGHPSTLHLWWARRPLAACRAMLLALLLPDPCDPHCPEEFKVKAREFLPKLTGEVGFEDIALRKAILKFIGDFADWDHTGNPVFLEVGRGLVTAAYPEEAPLVVDPFAGGGSIPLEALRLGCETFASDLNPVACLILKVMLEDIPRHGPELAEELRRVGDEIKKQAEIELAEFYPKDPDGATPIAYLWARTVKCESPNCGAEIPLVRSFWLCKKSNRKKALRYKINRNHKQIPIIEFEIFEPQNEREVPKSTVSNGNAICLCCHTLLQRERVRLQLAEQCGGANVVFSSDGSRIGGAILLAVVLLSPNGSGRLYRLAEEHDYKALFRAHRKFTADQHSNNQNGQAIYPNELLPTPNRRTYAVDGLYYNFFPQVRYGLEKWKEFFSERQNIALSHYSTIACQSNIHTAVALVLGKLVDLSNTVCPWEPIAECPRNVLSNGRIKPSWSFAEGVPISSSSASFNKCLENFLSGLASISINDKIGMVELACSQKSPLPDETVSIWFTDPPYYDAIPYAYLSEAFSVWLKRASPIFLQMYKKSESDLSEKEIIDDLELLRGIHKDKAKSAGITVKDKSFFESEMMKAFVEGQRILASNGVGCIVFAHQTTNGWEALLTAIICGGLTVTSSWPIATEMQHRLRARNSAALATSVHLICRPRPLDASVGDWSQVLKELPSRVGDWMERLQSEGVRGADLVFACIGPALEIFSRYSRVETAEGNEVKLADYLEKVWEVVGRIALEQVLGTAEARARNSAAGALEEDARLTALFLWTLQSTNGQNGNNGKLDDGDIEETDIDDDEEEEITSQGRAKGYRLVFDVVRRFAQPLGINLPRWENRIIKTEKGVVRLLPVKERAKQLFGEEGTGTVAEWIESEPQTNIQLVLFPEPERERMLKIRGRGRRKVVIDPSALDSMSRDEVTTLDRVHAAMLLQAGGQANALRALVKSEQERGPDFLRLANALSALYPKDSEEKRLLDAMLLAVPR
jgi:adenine-specific DNA methylase